jgi:hypothetical protein
MEPSFRNALRIAGVFIAAGIIILPANRVWYVCPACSHKFLRWT